ncbi:MAG: hypothetical protein IKN53_02145 [Oscillibacter sp.]|nr:hypothetical protein [Oscillibacter sp.]
MRRRICVPMMTLCLLLCACGAKGEPTAEDYLQPYREMTACEMTAAVSCREEGLFWSATIRATCEAEGEYRAEVLEPSELAGVRAVIDGDGQRLEYGDLTLNAGTLGSEEISPAAALLRVADALRNGWLLEENREEWDGTPCLRVLLDQTGAYGASVRTAVWLKTEDGAPLRAELAVDGETVLTAEFTDFTFCDTIEKNHERSE